MLRLERLAAAREQLIQHELARAGDLRDQAEQLIALLGRALRAHLVANAIEAGSEALVIDRLQQIVDRPRVEGANRVLVVRA